MKTLQLFATRPETIPASIAWYLADLGEARGRQELFTRQSPQKLLVLREHALIESAISSNRIEGVEVDRSRVGTVVFGKGGLRDRDEASVRGYRDALKLIHERAAKLQVSEETIRSFHRFCSGEVWDAGQYKEKDSDIVEKYPDGRERIRFKTVSARETPEYMQALGEQLDDRLRENLVHPLIALAAFNLDFLCIHPFRDGNGRVSRLLLLLQHYHLGYEVGRYISLERLIEQSKERYYETLEQSSAGWHEGKHDPWPYIGYLLHLLNDAYKELESRIGEQTPKKGAKAEFVLQAIARQAGEFRLSDIERACPGVGREWIRKLLIELKARGEVSCHGRGPGARWALKPPGRPKLLE